MHTYVALLRGIGPGNPNMSNQSLRTFFEGLGFSDVRSVISSGNIVFKSDLTDTAQLETMIEETLPKRLGFSSTVIVRSQEQLQELLAAKPFGNVVHGPSSYTLVTFYKHPVSVGFALPYTPAGKTYTIIGTQDSALFSLTDNTHVKTTDLMTWLEKQFGKEITSRTWLTVQRILKKMDV